MTLQRWSLIGFLAVGSSVSAGMIHYNPAPYLSGRGYQTGPQGTATDQLGYWKIEHRSSDYVLYQETVLGSQGLGGGGQVFVAASPTAEFTKTNMLVFFEINEPFPYLLSQDNGRVTLYQLGVGLVDMAFGDVHEASGVIGPGTYRLETDATANPYPPEIFISEWSAWYVAIPTSGVGVLAALAGLTFAGRRRG